MADDPPYLAAFRRNIRELPHGEQARIADVVGVTRNTFSAWGQGHKTPGHHNLHAAATAMGKQVVIADV